MYKKLTEESTTLIEASVWSFAVKFLMEDMSWTTPEMRPTSFTKTFTFLFLEELSPIDCPFIWMPTLFTTQWDHLVLLKSLPRTPKIKGSDFTCWSHQEFITDTHAALQAKDVKLSRLSLKRLIFPNLLANRHFSTLPKCIFYFI